MRVVPSERNVDRFVGEEEAVSVALRSAVCFTMGLRTFYAFIPLVGLISTPPSRCSILLYASLFVFDTYLFFLDFSLPPYVQYSPLFLFILSPNACKKTCAFFHSCLKPVSSFLCSKGRTFSFFLPKLSTFLQNLPAVRMWTVKPS